jgi:hypothetical protein
MGMSTHIKGFVSPENELYKNHSKVLLACLGAGIKELPKETAEFFDCKFPALYLLEEKLEINIPFKEYNEDMGDGYEVIISELPKEVYKIRFYNSY